MENIPEQLRPSTYDSQLQIMVYYPDGKNQEKEVYYKPIKGHYSSYVSQFVEKAESPASSLDTWDQITNHIGTWKITQLIKLAPHMLKSNDNILSHIPIDAGAKIQNRSCLKVVKSKIE